MTDCSSIHGSSSSSDITSSRGSNNPRIRVIRLTRPQFHQAHIGNPSFGFSLRGGREYGTGFFISRVEKGSEADAQGLRVGDQIVKVNGYHVDDAVHKELSQFIANQDRLTLKVRGVGIIPVKERSSDPLTWHVVPLKIAKCYDILDEISCRDIKITLSVAPRAKLGCGICKGPEWKPGIFIQFTKDGGIAREAGLRPGDQILSCNDIDFSDILFSEAVAIMKSSSVLELIVRTCAGLDLFPGESSGYNSSASSVTGDQSPCWGDHASKRLSIVREESLNSDDLRRNNFRPKTREKLTAIGPPKIPEGQAQGQTMNSNNPNPSANNNNNNNNNRTIIKLSENGTVINNTLIPNTENCSKSNTKLADICLVSRQSETKTVIVEVHRSLSTDSISKLEMMQTDIPPPPPPFANNSSNNNSDSITMDHDRSPSVISSVSSMTSSSVDCSSLSSAISEELKKRAERKSKGIAPQPPVKPKPLTDNQGKKFGNPLGNNDERHCALMDEFKKAHKRMFKNGFVENEVHKADEEERRSELNNRKLSESSNNSSIFSQRDTNSIGSLYAVVNKNNNSNKSSNNNLTNGISSIQKSNGITVTDGLPQNGNNKSPNIPTPDYESTPTPQRNLNIQNGLAKGTLGRVAAHEMARANGDTAELESIESFKMTNPASPTPRPPSVYFKPQSSGPPTMKKSQRQVAVTISEYGSNMNGNCRKEPGKFAFIGTKCNPNQKSEDLSENLKNELEKTLSRSNLKKRNDTENLGGKTTVTIFPKAKEVNNNNNTSNNHVNRVTIAIPNGACQKTEGTLPVLNGILKNSDNVITAANAATKNIKFDHVTIKEKL